MAMIFTSQRFISVPLDNKDRFSGSLVLLRKTKFFNLQGVHPLYKILNIDQYFFCFTSSNGSNIENFAVIKYLKD